MILEALGTLVLMVPSADGLVVAADSRTTVAGAYCDERDKLLEPNLPARTIATVTGHGTLVERSSFPIVDPCQFLREARRTLDIGAVVTEFLERKNVELPALSMQELADTCVEAVKQFAVARPGALEQFAGREMFLVVIAGYQPPNKTAHIRSFVVSVSEQLEPIAGPILASDIENDQPRNVLSFGEKDYLYAKVFRGLGRKFLSARTKQFLQNERPIREVSADDAAAVAEDIINATSKTTAIFPAPTGIGGPVDIVLLGAAARPRKMRDPE